MLGANQVKSGGTGVGASVEVRVGLGVARGIVVSVDLGRSDGKGVSGVFCGLLQVVTVSISNMNTLRRIMDCVILLRFILLSHLTIARL